MSEENQKKQEKRTVIEDLDLLKKFGVFIPGKRDFPKGFVKFSPLDFIVEEIWSNWEVYDTSYKKAEIFDITRQNFGEKSTIYATLVKYFQETHDAVYKLEKSLKTDDIQIKYAGLKDLKGVTAQRISIRNLKELEQLQNVLPKNIFIKDFYVGKGRLREWKLKWNRFTILLRTQLWQKNNKNDIQQQIDKVNSEGFYNYYYLQRFFDPRPFNYLRGISVLKGEYKKAVFDYLTCPASFQWRAYWVEAAHFEHIRNKIKTLWWHRDQILAELLRNPAYFHSEIKVVSYLHDYPEDFFGALTTIPKHVKLWVFGFASLLFNFHLGQKVAKWQNIPNQIPLVLSTKQEDISLYQDHLNFWGLDLRSFNRDVLQAFDWLKIKSRLVNTRGTAKILNFKAGPDGYILQLELTKGMYATTFLSHIFNLVSGDLPEGFSSKILNI